jgi:UDP-3-O-[3-hydroxymyristoyl] glucosamine N-acyltransferase
MKKYTIIRTDFKTTADGTKLYRIKALRNFSDVEVGTLGGYIEKKSNLSHEGNAWVYEIARVYGNAQVSGDAWVFGNAWVYEDALVSGNAQVFGNAQVYGDAWVYEEALVAGNARVYRDARVYGDARVFGNTQVFGDVYVPKKIIKKPVEVYGIVAFCEKYYK